LTKLENKDSNHPEIPLIKGLLFFHISELPKWQLYMAIGFLKFFCCSSDNLKNLEKILHKASYQKALDNLLKVFLTVTTSKHSNNFSVSSSIN